MFDRHDYSRRDKRNPILQGADFPGSEIGTIFNPGVTRCGDRYVMIARVEDEAFTSRRYLLGSEDGVSWTLEREVFVPETLEPEGYYVYLSDPRICPVDDFFVVSFCVHNDFGHQTALFRTTDFADFEFIEIVCEPENRNVVLFPRRIGGKYWRLSRPFRGGDHDRVGFWCANSPDLVYWGRHRNVIMPRTFSCWDNCKLGPGAAPIETAEGWLILHHGTCRNCNGLIYRAGLLLLDLEDPSRVIRRPKSYFFGPETDYEMIGCVPNVVFPTAAIVEPDRSVKIYYGAADTSIGLIHSSIDQMLDFVHHAP